MFSKKLFRFQPLTIDEDHCHDGGGDDDDNDDDDDDDDKPGLLPRWNPVFCRQEA